ncbi:MAG: hypothetical protein AAF959_22385, partial [Cyanobacteria bacterium P01_D01_bin.56]
DLMDLFFDSQHTTETMGLLLDDLGDMGFRSLFATVASPVSLAITRVELLSSMIDHLKTTDANGNVLGSVEPMKNLLGHGVKAAMKMPPDAEKLWSLIYKTIAEGPEDWTWALSELKWRTGQFELEPLVALVGTASNRYAARGATELVVELFAKEPSRERTTAVAEAWTLFANRTDLENYVVYNVAYRMPKRTAFIEYPEALQKIDQAMGVFQATFGPDESSYSVISAWLASKST